MINDYTTFSPKSQAERKRHPKQQHDLFVKINDKFLFIGLFAYRKFKFIRRGELCSPVQNHNELSLLFLLIEFERFFFCGRPQVAPTEKTILCTLTKLPALPLNKNLSSILIKRKYYCPKNHVIPLDKRGFL